MAKETRKRRGGIFRLATLTALSMLLAVSGHTEVKKMDDTQTVVKLPAPAKKGTMSVEEALEKRQSQRRMSSKTLSQEDMSQLLWAAQGTTRKWGGRTSPSAGALYPLELYALTNQGVYRYDSLRHELTLHVRGDLRKDLSNAALGQTVVAEAPAVFVIAAVYERLAGKYGNRAERYAKMEAGHAGQNILLQATAAGLAAVPIGAFQDCEVQKVLKIPLDHEPLYIIPVGKR